MIISFAYRNWDFNPEWYLLKHENNILFEYSTRSHLRFNHNNEEVCICEFGIIDKISGQRNIINTIMSSMYYLSIIFNVNDRQE